jgi:hypothetical protein
MNFHHLSRNLKKSSKKLKQRRKLRLHQHQNLFPPLARVRLPSLKLGSSIPSQKDSLAYPIQILGSGIDVNWPIIRLGGTVTQGSCSGACLSAHSSISLLKAQTTTAKLSFPPGVRVVILLGRCEVVEEPSLKLSWKAIETKLRHEVGHLSPWEYSDSVMCDGQWCHTMVITHHGWCCHFSSDGQQTSCDNASRVMYDEKW